MTDIRERIEAGAQTIGQAIGFDPMPSEAAPRLPEPQGWPGEGIFFGMSDADYHAIFACSASVLKDMSVSPMYAWAKSPLNPDREDDDTFAKELGRAYHVRICEGREAYDARYAIALDKADYPDALETADDIKGCIITLDAEPVSRIPTGQMKPSPTKAEPDRMKPVTRQAKKDDWIAQLLALKPDAQIWDALVDAHADSVGTRTLIRAQDDRRIQVAARMIESDPELAKAFSGGYPEVSLFWWDRATGAPCKARVDYLKMNAFVDLKSFSLKVERPVDRAIDYEIATRKHYVPVVHYSDGIAAVKALVRERGDGAITNIGDNDGSARRWAHRWAAIRDEPSPLYVFQATGIAPITRGKVLARGTVFAVTRMAVETLRRRWAECVSTYGMDGTPWLDVAPIAQITDENVPQYGTDFGDS